MKTKLIIFDAYGVCLTGGFPDTCKFLAKKFKCDWEEVYAILYIKYFNLAAEKKITQHEAWVGGITELNLPLSVAELKKIHYGLMGVNRNVLRIVSTISKQVSTILLSKNTRSQFADINAAFPELKKTFGKKNVWNTWEYNLPKASAETMQFVFKKYSIENPQSVIYTDDQASNLEVPKRLGVKTILYKNFNQFKKELTKFIVI